MSKVNINTESMQEALVLIRSLAKETNEVNENLRNHITYLKDESNYGGDSAQEVIAIVNKVDAAFTSINNKLQDVDAKAKGLLERYGQTERTGAIQLKDALERTTKVAMTLKQHLNN